MRFMSVEDIEPGQLLGRTVYSANGTVLLSAGVQLTVYMISTLKRIGVTMLYIKDADFEDVEIEDVISEATKQAVFREMSETLESIRSGKDWSTRKISTSVDTLLTDVLNNKEVLLQLTEIRTADNADYIHAVNVCLLSSMIGLNMGLNYSQLKDLAIGSLLHDIGKSISLPDDADRNDPKNHHTWRGFELLKHKREFNLLIAHTALQHHERLNGSGLPRGLDHEAIHLFAKIVAVANMYDNLIGGGGTGEGRAMLPHEACEKLMASSEQELDHEILIEFTRIVSVYPTGTSVRLSTKETGVVVSQHRGLPGRPVVRVIRGAGEDIDVKEVDLARETTLFIEAVLA
ncbi:HD-GYP domain-containing protein (c-di-GMP phosphodiesterase class II) [Fontibacillus solani]|uniref:HD-GYP domain-containing protein (C-di-GMP phosphodiesterase class II) n=1 Tax=Fontibacillus solani TaxID=1572857 RepID=A0A7W3XU10_9BACL|nr:HD domain-containing phosphohydrolase [Fontibacillus solani]MBA9088129.1 HD-GYP domain-containing protein (c-di-GMP phosphodiesterase class II) [Fontibacillus solani]